MCDDEGGISSIPLFRREAYAFCLGSCPPESVEDKRFKKLNMTAEEKLLFKSSDPRPALTFGRLQYIARRWTCSTRMRMAGSIEACSGSFGSPF